MKTSLFNFYHKTILGNGIRKIFHIVLQHLPDSIYQRYRFKKYTGKYLNLNQPKTLNEKINWLMLNDRRPLHTQCADKLAVRDYISKTIGPEFLVPLFFSTKKIEDISPKTITQTPCIIKTNHDSGGGYFIYDVAEIDWNSIRQKLKERLSKNYYRSSREWQYKNIEPTIIVEKLLLTEKGDIPYDFKIHCFNGNVRMIQVDIGRGTKNHFRNWYDINWKREPYRWSSPKGNGLYTDPSPTDVEKPETLGEMIRLSQTLSQPFDYVRVDWYDVDSKLYFGELTFHHDGGTNPIRPAIWDLKLGQELKLTNHL
ncbi:ATP-grasp fold amidoligase family protein [Zobellia galactanivorans]|uniref:ATP-grasp fold amidoligase family protein n=1 Tax=Zobellia TaxID=112040 RepID=UPI000B535FC8|nr:MULTISPECIES: ATP-grasp fold amidoligase family protein [Zobellia]MDO6807520.1 ATP-grasp fold amidoligase family protein [Zobellia galactanivorans]OWW24229.1 glycosyl transferase [Zobellia sp. OII3]